MDVIKLLLTLSAFVTPCLWPLTLQDHLQAHLLTFMTTDSQMTGLLTLREQSDLPTLSGLVWWLIIFTIRTFWLHTLQELIDLLTFNGLTCKDLQMTGLLKLQEQTDTYQHSRFGMMTNTIYNMNILIAYITRTHRFTDI